MNSLLSQRRSTAAIALAVIASLLAPGCDNLRGVAPAPAHRLSVIPSETPRRTFEITVRDERYLGDIARRLGTTVEALIRDNDLPDGRIREGMTLKVHVTEAAVERFNQGQRDRAERRRERIEARKRRAAEARRKKEEARRKRIERRKAARRARLRRKRRLLKRKRLRARRRAKARRRAAARKRTKRRRAQRGR